MLPRPEDQYLPKLWDIELGVTESGESRFVKLKDWRPAILVIDTPGSAKQEFIDSFKARNPPEDPAEPSDHKSISPSERVQFIHLSDLTSSDGLSALIESEAIEKAASGIDTDLAGVIYMHDPEDRDLYSTEVSLSKGLSIATAIKEMVEEDREDTRPVPQLVFLTHHNAHATRDEELQQLISEKLPGIEKDLADMFGFTCERFQVDEFFSAENIVTRLLTRRKDQLIAHLASGKKAPVEVDVFPAWRTWEKADPDPRHTETADVRPERNRAREDIDYPSRRASSRHFRSDQSSPRQESREQRMRQRDHPRFRENERSKRPANDRP